MSAPWAGRRLHFVGVGGAGMSGYARVAHALGAEVSGSDGASSDYLRRLAADGVLEASIGHAAANLPPGEDVELIYSSAVPPSNPEREAARERGLPERPRADLLAELSALRRTIAVAGTHGKTTTASMIAHALRAAGAEPGWLIGGTGSAVASPTRRGGRAAGWSSRPMSPIARCSASTSRSPCSRTSRWITMPRLPPSASCARPSGSS